MKKTQLQVVQAMSKNTLPPSFDPRYPNHEHLAGHDGNSSRRNFELGPSPREISFDGIAKLQDSMEVGDAIGLPGTGTRLNAE